HVPAIHKAAFVQTLIERSHKVCPFGGRSSVEETDHRHCWLLRASRQRPRSRRAAEQRHELAPLDAEHGELLPCRLASPPGPIGRRRLMLGLRTLSLPQKDRQVLGTDLNCSES